MAFARRLGNVDNIPQQESALNGFAKLTRTYATQLKALKRYRTGGEQKVTVQHVNVSEGGQAIVGNVTTQSRRAPTTCRCPPGGVFRPAAGTKGERLHDWAYLELADLASGEYKEALDSRVWTRGLLIRRKIADGDLAFFTTWAPSGTTIEALAKIEGHRWAIEDSFARC